MRQKCINRVRLRASDRSFSDKTHVHFPFIFLGLFWQQLDSLTFSLLIFRGFNKTLELDIDMDLNAQQESHFEQH